MVEIDYIVCYIDYSQKEIVELWEKTTGNEYGNNANHVYLDFSLIVKQILKNLPFIRNLYIVCKDIQKLPDDLNELIRSSDNRIIRVNESEIMPNNYITFSSACIEMFLWKIPGLSEYFIYGNDDMIPLKPLSIDNFFEDGVPHIRFNKYKSKFGCLYDLHNSNNTNLIFNRIKNNDEYSECLRTEHTIRPMRKSICEKCYDEYESFIMSSLYKVRYFNNFNFDLYMLYGVRYDMIRNKQLNYKFLYQHANQYKLKRLSILIDNGYYDMLCDVLCINDSLGLEENNCDGIKSEFLNLIEKVNNPPSKSETTTKTNTIRRFRTNL